VIILLPPSPTAPVKEKNDRSGPADFRADDVQNLAFMHPVGKVQGFGYFWVIRSRFERRKAQKEKSPKEKMGR
jgi:hypothetical protein